MFIYNGKLTAHNASNETITVVFPAGFELNDPVSAYWQWSNDPRLDNKKASVANSSIIRTVTKTSDGSIRRIHFSFDSSSFDGTVKDDFKTLSLTMLDSAGTPSAEFDLTAMHRNATAIPSAVVYTGNLDFHLYATQEMTTIVVPYSVTEGAFFGLYYQWTRSPSNNAPKQSIAIAGRFKNVEVEPNGSVTATYEEGEYKYEFTFDSDKKGSFVMSDKRRRLGISDPNHFVAAYRV